MAWVVEPCWFSYKIQLIQMISLKLHTVSQETQEPYTSQDQRS